MEEEQDRHNDEVMELTTKQIEEICNSVRKHLGKGTVVKAPSINMDEKDFGEFENKTGFVFIDKALLKKAFTHRSYLNENRSEGLAHNERLEFLGDAILGMVIAEYLFYHLMHPQQRK